MAVIQALELRDSSGTYVAAIQHFYAGHWTQAANACDELRFSVPTSELPEGFDFDQQIWLRRGDGADIARKFIITEIQTHEGSQDRTDVTCYDYLSILGKLTVTDFPGEEYEGTEINARVLVSLLLLQQSSLTMGTVPPSRTVDYDAVHTESGTLLQVLQKIRQEVGGLVWVDNDYRLHWYTTRYADHGFSLDLDRNLIDYAKTESRMGEDIQISYDLKAVDLSQISDADEGMLNIGMPVTLTPAGETLYVTDIDQDLGNPLNLSLALGTSAELSGRRPDLIDFLTDFASDGGDHERRITNLENAEVVETEIEYGTDADIQSITTSNSAGMLDRLARADHAHAITFGTDVKPVAAANAAGTLDEAARVDHEHAGQSLDYGEAGDIQAVAEAAAAGTSEKVARADHAHPVTFGETADIEAVGEANAAGTSPKFARADHVHKGTSGTDFQYGKVVSLSDDGNKISVYLWVEDEERWETEVTEIYKPHILAADNWNGQTLSGTDGHNVSYYKLTKHSRTTIDYYGSSEVQFITPAYCVDEVLTITTNPVTGELTDQNNAGRSWASYEED